MCAGVTDPNEAAHDGEVCAARRGEPERSTQATQCLRLTSYEFMVSRIPKTCVTISEELELGAGETIVGLPRIPPRRPDQAREGAPHGRERLAWAIAKR